MAETTFEFISASDKPALVAFSNPEWLEAAKGALNQLGYKVHTAATHTDFVVRFGQLQYKVVIIEELFSASTPGENQTLRTVQNMPMNQRRHATIILIGTAFQTFSPMQAFQQSVHAVVNASELFLLNQLIEKAVADTTLFLTSFRQAQSRAFGGGAPVE